MAKSTSKTRTILEYLATSGALLIDSLFPRYTGDFLPNIYPRRIRIPTEPKEKSKPINKGTLSSVLWRMKRDGIVTNRGTSKKKQWRITAKGRLYLKTRPPRQKFLKVAAVRPSDGMVRLVSFDIPEKERTKRKWLYKELVDCGYKPLHKSVFVGTRPLPKDMVREIDLLGLGHYTHIAALKKTGTIVKKHLSE